MEARAELKHVRISPRKVGIVLDLIRNKPVDVAMATLKLTPKAASEPLQKLLKSVMANAEINHMMDLSSCYVSACWVGAGITMKRIRPKDHGRAHRILKRTSNIFMVVREKE
ncbi:MAG: 50S ribosomal protein L22 [Oscillospiraceae bacterium]|nr:50S ribosomal protein L22 [Oscillospiraceae bacterium]